MKMLRLAAALALLASPALAQTGTVTNHAFAVGKGPGVTGFTSLLCTSAQLAVGQAAADPICQTLTGDVTISAGGVTAIGATKVTSAMLNTDVFSTAHSWAGQQTFTAPVLGTPASGTLTNATGLPVATGISGLGTGVATFLTTPNSANLRAAITDEVGTGAAYFVGGALGTPASVTLTNGTGLPLAGLAAQGANTIVANATAGSASPTAVSVPSCSGANQAINWTSGTGPGCATIAGSGGAWSNTRLAKTAAYTVLSADAGSTIALGGSAFFPLTFNAASGYSATAAFLVTNEDASFGKLIIPQLATSATSFTIGTGSKAFTTTSGLPISVYSTPSSSQRYRVYSLANPANFMSGTVTAYATTTLTILVDTIGGSGTFTDWQIAPEIRLWPGQSRWVFNQNNVWNLDPAKRWKLLAETEICVDAVSGSDSNDGLGVGSRCFQHIQFAANVVYQDWDANNFPPDVGIYTGPFNESVGIQGQLTGYNFLRFRTRAANTWTNTATCIAVSDNAEAIFDATFGFTQTWTCNTANVANTGAIYEHQVAVIDISGAHKWVSGGANDSFFFADGEGRATISGSGAGIIIGNSGVTSGFSYVTCNYHCSGVTTGGTVSWGGTISLSAFYVAKAGSVIDHSANPTGTPGTIGVALPLGNSVIRLNGLTPPGGTPTASFQGVCATTC